ncbi:cytoadherence linked asexual protein, CLAG [Plasmodium gonderi]|uniref:Cytoadherence linked asexual protein, CLAG n=1 Tax=Plasmodium gonderi TaxID=77519 RepID=A0A1Y1JL11_PLAGO|nr:cytoadherence linked asexual protein, CLAG [Plasmodium gonderi]GAW83216.1 cytoadherence linked asexual protein, CLAG [Plasmodium gonderi]
MTLLLNTRIFFLFLLLFLSENVIGYVNENESIEQLKYVIDNKEMFDNLTGLERLIIQTLKFDELQLPVLKPNVQEYLNMSNFMIVKVNTNSENEIDIVVPNTTADIHDIVKYEHITRQQIIQTYDSENSDLVKKKFLLLKALKTTKLMLMPMYTYKETKDFKKSLEALNAFFFQPEEVDKNKPYLYSKTYFDNVINYVNEIKKREPKENAYSTMIIGEEQSCIQNSSDFFFTTNDDIEFMKILDKVSNHFGIAMFNSVGSNLVALGHFVVLQLALKKYDQFFKHGKMRFFNWQTILSFNALDRFRILDTMCNVQGFHDVQTKRRIVYLKDDRSSSYDECSILEFLVHYFNKYQISLISNLYQDDFKTHYLSEHVDIKNEFFKFMCNDIKQCNIYNSKIFLSEDDTIKSLNSDAPSDMPLSPYNLYTNYFYFTRSYSQFTPNHILYVHFLNLTGILNNDNMAFVTSIYLPGYYNAIELSFDQESLLTDLIENLLQCVEKCNLMEVLKKASIKNNSSEQDYGQSISTKCNLCKGVFTYINSKYGETSSMLQKFFTFVTKSININSVSTLIRNLSVYEEYNNFLTNDVNWYTFLLLLRLTSFKKIAEKNVAEAMYLDLKNEDKFNKTVTTNYWYPSYLKKAYTLYVKNKLAINLVEKLENLLNKGTIEKMKKSVRFLVHVNSFLQLDFFHNLNEPRPKEDRMNPLSMVLENKFTNWLFNSNLGYFFLNYYDPTIRNQMHEKLRSDRFLVPRFQKVSVVLKNYFMKAYEFYFNQRHVNNLYKNYDHFNISNKIMVMRDSYESYLENYKDVIFLADIFNIRKYLSATPKAKRVTDRIYYYIHNILGNSVNFYKYGMIYGFIINKKYLKEVSDELFSIYKLNKHIFTDTSFMETVYLLFRKIESSFNVHRRNDKISINNLFFLNVSHNYSKMNKEDRLEELNNSMASRFFSKTLFSTFQTMFSTMLSNRAEKLDRMYGTANMLGLTMNDQAFLNFSYAFYGSIMDNITNSLLPPYAKKPIEQLKYGKTFILSNYFMLASQTLSLLNLNNLSLLCEYQAISSANYHSSKKLGRFVDKKMIGIIVYYLNVRIQSVISHPNEFKAMLGPLTKASAMHPAVCLTVHMASNLYFDTPIAFPNTMASKLGEQANHVTLPKPSGKLPVSGFTKDFILEFINGMSLAFTIFPFLRTYAFEQNVVYFFINPVRLFDRFHTPVDSYIKSIVRKNFKKYTTDEFLRFLERSLLNLKRRGKMEEAVKARLDIKMFNENSIIQGLKEDLPRIAPQEYERLQKMDSELYEDDNLLFDSLDDEEKFLNDKYVISNISEDEVELSSKRSTHSTKDNKSNNKVNESEEIKTDIKEPEEEISDENSEKEVHEPGNENEENDDEDMLDEKLMIKRTPPEEE